MFFNSYKTSQFFSSLYNERLLRQAGYQHWFIITTSSVEGKGKKANTKCYISHNLICMKCLEKAKLQIEIQWIIVHGWKGSRNYLQINREELLQCIVKMQFLGQER